MLVGLVAAVSVVWLIVMPADFSSIDKFGQPIDAPYYSWRSLLLLASLLTLAFIATRMNLASKNGAIVVIGLTSMGWYVYRSTAARTSGANMWAVGVVLFTPLFFGVAALGTKAGEWWRRRSTNEVSRNGC
jgi:hypothetical protein